MPNLSLTKTKRSGVVDPTEIDYARLAAYIDGEGCISLSATRKATWKNDSVYANVSVHNTDCRLIDWCVERWGGRVYQTNQTNHKWSTAFGWRVTCQQARAILERCLPYFVIKREQAELAIALQKTQKRWGRSGCPQEVRELRWSLRNQLSEMKGSNSRIKVRKPKLVDGIYQSQEKEEGRVQ